MLAYGMIFSRLRIIFLYLLLRSMSGSGIMHPGRLQAKVCVKQYFFLICLLKKIVNQKQSDYSITFHSLSQALACVEQFLSLTRGL